MNYEDMSDFEINKAVAEAIGHQVCVSHHPGSENAIIIVNGSARAVDYCNNWSDGGPIIVENGIGLAFKPHCECDGWVAARHIYGALESNREPFTYHENPLRAAMIVFLKMQESKHLP